VAAVSRAMLHRLSLTSGLADRRFSRDATRRGNGIALAPPLRPQRALPKPNTRPSMRALAHRQFIISGLLNALSYGNPLE
jgi:hypothetical protein